MTDVLIVICNSQETGNFSNLNNSSDVKLPRRLSPVEIVTFTTMASLTVIANLVVLFASKFTSGGGSPTLVFVRSLCVSDVLVGTYGIAKMVMYFFLDLLVDFFLPESLFFTASLAYGLSLLCLNFDCFLKLSQPLQYSQHLDKKNIITIMIMLWNMSFIIGFLPQMGWRNEDCVHRFFFFRYYQWPYLLLVVVLLVVIMLSNCVVLILVKKHTNMIKSHCHFISPTSANFCHYHRLIVTSFIDVCFLALCYLPLFIYFAFYCSICSHFGMLSGDTNIRYFIPVFLVKSFISAIVHGYRTVQINEVMKRLTRRVSQIVSKSYHKSSIQSVAYTNTDVCDQYESLSQSRKYSNNRLSTETEIDVIVGSEMTLTAVHHHNHVLEVTKL